MILNGEKFSTRKSSVAEFAKIRSALSLGDLGYASEFPKSGDLVSILVSMRPDSRDYSTQVATQPRGYSNSIMGNLCLNEIEISQFTLCASHELSEDIQIVRLR